MVTAKKINRSDWNFMFSDKSEFDTTMEIIRNKLKIAVTNFTRNSFQTSDIKAVMNVFSENGIRLYSIMFRAGSAHAG